MLKITVFFLNHSSMSCTEAGSLNQIQSPQTQLLLPASSLFEFPAPAFQDCHHTHGHFCGILCRFWGSKLPMPMRQAF